MNPKIIRDKDNNWYVLFNRANTVMTYGSFITIGKATKFLNEQLGYVGYFEIDREEKEKPLSAISPDKIASIQRSIIRYAVKEINHTIDKQAFLKSVLEKPLTNKVKNAILGISKSSNPEDGLKILIRRIAMNRVNVSSSNIKSVGYDKERQELEVEFNNGGLYSYPDFPEDLFNDFMNASSKGSFFHSNIKYEFSFRKLK